MSHKILYERVKQYSGLSKEIRKETNYEKPLFEKEGEMVFPREIIEEFNGSKYCVQCSSCHGCR